MKVSAQYAADHIADLFLVARKGEEVEIVAPDKSSLRLALVPMPESPAANAGIAEVALSGTAGWKNPETLIWRQPPRPRSELLGSLEGRMKLADDWDSVETNAQIQELFEGSNTSEKMSQG